MHAVAAMAPGPSRAETSDTRAKPTGRSARAGFVPSLRRATRNASKLPVGVGKHRWRRQCASPKASLLPRWLRRSCSRGCCRVPGASRVLASSSQSACSAARLEGPRPCGRPAWEGPRGQTGHLGKRGLWGDDHGGRLWTTPEGVPPSAPSSGNSSREQWKAGDAQHACFSRLPRRKERADSQRGRKGRSHALAAAGRRSTVRRPCRLLDDRGSRLERSSFSTALTADPRPVTGLRKSATRYCPP